MSKYYGSPQQQLDFETRKAKRREWLKSRLPKRHEALPPGAIRIWYLYSPKVFMAPVRKSYTDLDMALDVAMNLPDTVVVPGAAVELGGKFYFVRVRPIHIESKGKQSDQGV